MKIVRFFACILLAHNAPFSFAAERQQSSQVSVDLAHPGNPLDIDHMALGQGGLSPDPIWESRVPEVRALHPKIIRLFVQEYFDVLPSAGQFHWETLDKSVDNILRAGAIPLMSIDIKPKVLFPTVDQKITDPNDYAAWDELITAMVKHYKEISSKSFFWEVANEPDIGEDGGCPYLFTPDGYVRYYAHTAKAVKRGDPDALVGGPALANPESAILPALLKEAQASNLPLDFISWHIYNSNPQKIRATIDRKMALLKDFPALHPKTVLDEWNMSLSHPVTDPRFQPAFVAETIWQMKEGGLDYSCYYHIRDYHVEPAIFNGLFSAKGAAAMAAWWNLKPQYDGLFDYENHVRPAYFAFTLLGHLTGRQLPLESNNAFVHGFATYDDYYGKSFIVVWNFSGSPINTTLALHGVSRQSVLTSLTIDATAPSDDQNIRLRPGAPIDLSSGDGTVPITLAPWQLTFWSLEKR